MKKTFLILLAMVLITPKAQAQLFSDEGIGGAIIGAIAGGIIGHNNGRKTWEGALIGTGTGLLAGTILGQDQRSRGYSSHTSYPYRSRSYSSYRPGYSYGYTDRRYHTGGRYEPAYYQQPTYAQPTYYQQPTHTQSAYYQQPTQYRQPVYRSSPVFQQPAYIPTQTNQHQPACSSNHQPTIIIIQQGGGGGYRYSY